MKSSFDLSLHYLRDGALSHQQLGARMYPYLRHAVLPLCSDFSGSLPKFTDEDAAVAAVKQMCQTMAMHRGHYWAYGIEVTVTPPKGVIRRYIVGLLTAGRQPCPLTGISNSQTAPLLSIWIAPAEYRPVPTGHLLPHVLGLLDEALARTTPKLHGRPWTLVDPTNSYVGDVLTQTAAFGGFESCGEVPPDGDGPARHLYVARSKVA